MCFSFLPPSSFLFFFSWNPDLAVASIALYKQTQTRYKYFNVDIKYCLHFIELELQKGLQNAPSSNSHDTIKAALEILFEANKKHGNKDILEVGQYHLKCVFSVNPWSMHLPLTHRKAFSFWSGKRPDKQVEYFSNEGWRSFLSTRESDQSAPWGGRTYTTLLLHTH